MHPMSRRLPSEIRIDVGGRRRSSALYVKAETIAYEDSCEAILNRLAAKLGCEPRQVADRVIRMLEERQK